MSEERLDALEERISRIERWIQIQKMKDMPVSREVQGLLRALEKLPAMAPYIEDDDE